MGKIKGILIKYRELILYVFFGGLTTLVNWGSFWLMFEIIHMDYLLATALAWVFSVIFAYITNRIWVFESKVTAIKAVLIEIAAFFAFRLLSGGMDMLLMYIGVDLLQINELLMKLVSNVFVVIANYIFSKLFIFRKKNKETDADTTSAE